MSGTVVQEKWVRSPAEEREWVTANAAYYLAEKRGFEPGQELEDWFRAEEQIVAKHPDKPVSKTKSKK